MRFYSITFVAGLVATGITFFSLKQENTNLEVPESLPVVVAEDSVIVVEDTLIHIVAVGDMMLGTNYPSSRYLPPSAKELLAPFTPMIQAADIAFGNLEGTLLDKGGHLKSCSDPAKCYAFRQPISYADVLKEAGFDMLSIANNHLGDFGAPGRKSTIDELEKRDFTFAGQLTRQWDTMTVKGVKVGFTAFAPNSGCNHINHLEEAKELVELLDSLCDVVIVSFHGGAEGKSKTHITRKHEYFYGEDRGDVYHFSRMVIDAGADVVLGHGPHVTRAIDHYKGRFICYSMGNFCTYHRFNLSGINGIAPIFKLSISKTGVFVNGEVVSIKQLGEGGPVLDTNHRALGQIKSLTKTDIPELKVKFSETGAFTFE